MKVFSLTSLANILFTLSNELSLSKIVLNISHIFHITMERPGEGFIEVNEITDIMGFLRSVS